MSIDLSRLPSKLTIRAGERTDLELPAYGGSGNYWSVQGKAGDEVANVSVATTPTEAPRPEAGEEPPTAAVAPERAVVEGVVPGTARYLLVLDRDFETGDPTAQHELEIVVTDDPAAA